MSTKNLKKKNIFSLSLNDNVVLFARFFWNLIKTKRFFA